MTWHRAWIQGRTENWGYSAFSQSATEDLHAPSVFLKVKKGTREDVHHSSLKDQELAFPH